MGKGGLHDNITLPGPPTDWKPPSIKVEKVEPHFESVENVGNWSEYTFRPEFEKKAAGGHYQGYTLPNGATPVPASGRGRTDKKLTSTLVIRTFLSFELPDIFKKYGSRLFFKKA